MTPSLMMLAALAVSAEPMELKVTKIGELPGERPIPVAVFSPDKKHLVYVLRDREKGGHVYQIAKGDGSEARELFRTPIDLDDVLIGLTWPSNFSTDGTKFAVLTTKNGSNFRSDLPAAGGVRSLTGDRYSYRRTHERTESSRDRDRLAVVKVCH